MEYIRKHYGVPAKRGALVRFTPDGNENLSCEGIITGSRGQYLRVRMGEQKRAGIYHPTCDIEYVKS